MINKILLTVVCWFTAIAYSGAQSLSLEECYQLARANYPAIKKMTLINEVAKNDLQNVNRQFLPQLNLAGQATYQSQTLDFADALGPMPAGISFPNVNKDQYKVQAELSQLIYDGGNTKNQKDLISANAALQEQAVTVNLYALKQRINHIYFSLLLMKAQLQQNEIKKSNIQSLIEKTAAAVENGTAFRSNLNELKAELINVAMTGTSYQSAQTAYLKMLSLLIGKELPATVELQMPETNSSSAEINRPELKTYDLQKAIYDVQRKQLSVSYLPKVSAFLQGAYGRPTLNIIANKFGSWYITGLKFNWSLGSLYTLTNKKNSLSLRQKLTAVDRETFLLNTRIDLAQQDEEVRKYTQLIVQDNEAIALRSSVTRSAGAQLANGVITTHEYLQQLNAEDLAKQTKILHEIQLIQAKYNRKFISNND